MAERLILRAGCAPWLHHGHGAASLVALLALLAADAEPGWKAAAAAALVLAHALCARHMADARMRGRLHLAADGEALLFTAGGVRALRQQPGGWHSRSLCVLPLADAESGRYRRFLLCRSLNRPDAWRRLLVHLKLQGQGAP